MQIKSFLKQNLTSILLVITSSLFYINFAYDLVRKDTAKLILLYTALFFLFYKFIQLYKYNPCLLAWLAFGFRAIFILAMPNLSQDFYRFIWDGRIILEGINPYLHTPESFIANGKFPIAQAQEIFNGMGTLSASHHSNYPPLNQLYFVIAGLFAGNSILGSVAIMRLLIITADFGTFYFGKKLLKKLKMPTYHIFWYILNPFIIIELTGNLHFDGVMIFFLVWSLYLLVIGKWQWSAITFSLSVLMKLVPLLFLPAFYIWFTKNERNNLEIWKQVQDNNANTSETKESATNENTNTPTKKNHTTPPNNNRYIPAFNGMLKLIGFYGIVCFVFIISFLPFLSLVFITIFTETTALWFHDFEFNASIFYLVRAIGYSFVDFNIITYYGLVIALIIPTIIFLLVNKRKHKTSMQGLIITMLFAISLYYATATTIHPWYLAMPLILAVFTRYKFPIIWSCTIILSYSAYGNNHVTENLWVLAIEYVLVYALFIYEVILKKPITI